MNIPDNLKYTKDHEWAKVEGNIVLVGLTDYAQSQLNDIVYVELPKIGDTVQQFQPFGSVEAVKAVSDLFSPVSGKVTEVNENLESDAGIINRDPYGEGWIIKVEMSNSDELNALLSADDYKKLIESS